MRPAPKFTPTERLILANQFSILAALYPNEQKSYERRREILESGYERDYGDLFSNIDSEPLSVEESQFVVDVLNMHRELRFSYDKLEQADREGIDPDDIAFHGFDGNEEARLLGYCHHVCGEDGPDRKFRELERGDDFNSHMPTVRRYRAMVDAWRQSRDQHRLTKDDIARIVGVRA